MARAAASVRFILGSALLRRLRPSRRLIPKQPRPVASPTSFAALSLALRRWSKLDQTYCQFPRVAAFEYSVARVSSLDRLGMIGLACSTLLSSGASQGSG